MKIYLAGPMSGYPGNNYQAFDAASANLRQRGFDVISPAELSREQGIDGTRILEPHEYAGCMRCDIEALLKVEGVICLPGWRKSKGARYEVHTAQLLGLKVLEFPDCRPVSETIVTFCPEE